MKHKLAAILCLFFASLAWGQDGPPITTSQLILPVYSVNLTPASQANTSLVGNPGPQTIYYWMVSNFTLGSSSPIGPFVVTNAPNVLSSGNYVAFTPVYPAGITSIDLLKTSSPIPPTGACNCAVATAVASGTINDQSNSTSSYTVAPIVVANYTQTLTNEVQGAGVTHLILRQNGVFVADLSTAATGGLPTGCSPGQIPSFNGTTWVCTSGGTGTVTGPGTSGRIAEWNGTLSLGNAPISDSGSLLSFTEPLSLSAGNTAGTSVTSAATATTCAGSATFFNTTSIGCRNASFLINSPSSASGLVEGAVGVISDPIGGTSGSSAMAGVYGAAEIGFNTSPNFAAGVAGFGSSSSLSGAGPNYLVGLSGIATLSGSQTPGKVIGVYGQAANQAGGAHTLPFGAAFYADTPLTTSPFTLLYGYYQVGSEANLFHGTLTTTGFIDSTITAGVSPLCPNGPGGAFVTTGCTTGSSTFAGLAPGTNTSTTPFSVAPASNVGGSTATWSFLGVLNDTNTAPLVNIDTAGGGVSGTQQRAFRVGTNGFSQFQVCNLGSGGAAFGANVFGSTIPCTSLSLAGTPKNFFQSGIGTHTVIRVYQDSTSETGPLIQAITKTTAGTGFDVVEGWTGATGTGGDTTGATKSFAIQGDGSYLINGCGSTTYVKADGTGCGTPPGGGSTTPNYIQAFTSQTTITMLGTSHNFGNKNLLLDCYDTASPAQHFQPASWTIDSTTFNVVVNFAASQSGYCVLNGAIGGAGTTRTWLYTYQGVCQAGVASASVNFPTANAPSYVACSSTNITPEWQIPASNTTDTFWVKLRVPTGHTGAYTLTTTYRSAATSGTATVQPTYACVAAGAVPDNPSFSNAGSSFTLTPAGTTLQNVTTTDSFTPTCADAADLYVMYTFTANSVASPINFSYVSLSVQGSL